MKLKKEHCESSEKTFDVKSMSKILMAESTYITNLWKQLPLHLQDLTDMQDVESKVTRNKQKPKIFDSTKGRAKSLEELHQRLEEMRGQRKQYKGKLLKQNLKNRLLKKKKQEEVKLKKTLVNVNKQDPSFKMKAPNAKPVKPVFNSEGKMVFSKFDFTESGARSQEVNSKKEKELRDPQKILKKLEKQKEKLQEFEEEGKVEKVKEFREKQAWKTALQKSSGIKVKDNPELLKKTLKKQAERKKHSKKKWIVRDEKVKKQQEDKQQRRLANINDRKKQKKMNKLKRAAKKGRIIPGLTKL